MIGKNNSGKSNILSAIHTFFLSIKSGSIVSSNSVLRKDTDFFNKMTQNPIELTFTFSLSFPERDTLLHEIVIGAPQRKNAVDGIGADLLLSIAVTFVKKMPQQTMFSFVSEITLKSAQMLEEVHQASEMRLLSVKADAALELRDQLIQYIQENRDMKILERLPDLLARRDRYVEEPPSLREYLRRILSLRTNNELSPELRKKLDNIAGETVSIEDLSRKVEALKLQTHAGVEPSTGFQGKLSKYKISTFAGDETTVPKYITSLLQQVSKIKVLYLTERRKEIGKDEAEQILSLKVERGGDETFRNIQSIVKSLLGVNINAFKDRGAENAELDIDNFIVEVNGSGIREALRLALDNLFEKPNILLVEEPEIHLHPGLEITMMEYLKQISIECQVFITTHSTNFLDTYEMKNVYLVSKNGATKTQQLNIEEAEAQIPKELGIRLSSLFMFDRLVFVEGSSDEAVIRAWAGILGVNLTQSNVGFITMQGSRNFMYYAAKSTLSFLKKRQVKMWFIIDRDEKDDTDIAKLKGLLNENASFKVLKKREIENYLICSQPIARLIQKKSSSYLKGSRDIVLLEAEISKLIEKAAEQLKQITIDKRVFKALCRPIYPSVDWIFDEQQVTSIIERIISEERKLISELENTINRADAIYKYQSELVDGLWQSDKLSLVPGDHLLDKVCQEYILRFNKDVDGPYLASFMTKDEIDPEIHEIIQEIGD